MAINEEKTLLWWAIQIKIEWLVGLSDAQPNKELAGNIGPQTEYLTKT